MALTMTELRSWYLASRLPSKDVQEFVLKANPKEVQQCYEVTLGQSAYSPPIQFRRKWATFIIKQLDFRKLHSCSSQFCEGEEEYSDLDAIIDQWYDALEHLSTLHPQVEPFYRFYSVNGAKAEELIQIYENEDAFVCNGTTGLVTWEASVQLAKYFASDPQTLESVNWIVELGSGCGYLAIATVKLKQAPRANTAAAKTVISNYIATDASSDALSHCQKNLVANFGQELQRCPIKLLKVDWTGPEDVQEFVACVEEATKQHGAGCLIGADIVFDPELIPSLTHLFNTFLAIQTSNSCPGKVVLSSETRNESTAELLMSQLRVYGRKLDQVGGWTTGRIISIT